MLVAIPSKGRPHKVKSAEILKSATLFVPESEAEAYQVMGHERVVAVPAAVRGITRTRNWILDNVEDPWVVMVDDDVIAAGYIELLERNSKHRRGQGEDFWLGEFRKLFEVTEDLGFRVWGISTEASLRSVYPYKPFLFHSYVTASCMGILNYTGIRFDERFPVKEDYELCLRCIKEDGGVVAARYLYWQNSHWADKGGCHDYRTQEMEREAIKGLKGLYPGMVRVATDRKGQFCISLNFNG